MRMPNKFHHRSQPWVGWWAYLGLRSAKTTKRIQLWCWDEPAPKEIRDPPLSPIPCTHNSCQVFSWNSCLNGCNSLSGGLRTTGQPAEADQDMKRNGRKKAQKAQKKTKTEAVVWTPCSVLVFCLLLCFLCFFAAILPSVFKSSALKQHLVEHVEPGVGKEFVPQYRVRFRRNCFRNRLPRGAGYYWSSPNSNSITS